MPRRNEAICPYDAELVEELKKCHSRAERKVVLNSRKLSIITADGKSTTTCVLPLDVYDRLEKMKRSYRTFAYLEWRKAHGGS